MAENDYVAVDKNDFMVDNDEFLDTDEVVVEKNSRNAANALTFL